MSTQFTRIDHVSKSAVHLVNGYVKKIQELLPLSPYYNISPLITNTIIIYYFLNEYFEKCSAAKGLSITGINKCVLSKSANACREYDNVSFGHQWIPSNTSHTYKWTIKVLENGVEPNNVNNGIMIGIVSNEVPLNIYRAWECIDVQQCYFWCWGDIYFRNGDDRGILMANYNKKIYFGNKGEVLTMKVNMNKQELIFYINRRYCGVAATDIVKQEGVKYKLAVVLFWPETKIQIQDFQCVPFSK